MPFTTTLFPGRTFTDPEELKEATKKQAAIRQQINCPTGIAVLIRLQNEQG